MAQAFPLTPRRSASAAGDGMPLEEILGLLRDRLGLDLSEYRRATLERRVLNRMLTLGVADARQYVERLREEPAEAQALLQRLTIKVSRFFRNREAFEVVSAALRERAELLRRPLRLWSAGCGNGEEAYSLALVLEQARLEGGVVGTDLDSAALQTAASGLYRDEALAEVAPECRERFFRREGGQSRVDERLRARVRFESHDLGRAQSAPEPRQFDLVCCRNVLIYFQPVLQERVQQLLVESLHPQGLLWLGESEWPREPRRARLEVVDRPARLFRRTRASCAGETE